MPGEIPTNLIADLSTLPSIVTVPLISRCVQSRKLESVRSYRANTPNWKRTTPHIGLRVFVPGVDYAAIA